VVAKDVLVGPGRLDQAADFDLEGWGLYARLSEFHRLLRNETEIVAQNSAETG
jgi:hypothetical protein